ncbi:MAG: hypothetical protein HC895_09875 [Leptolyngbyaceae cyanobacterium SM1_3_5]|nr:hypothetical protein [Leptolyngbyaceae cyanobacterium SM1_3_5]
MVDPMDNIARQAQQGSVAAIIAILNEKLADSGVRTRAMIADGALQVLCEAPSIEQLEQASLVDRVRQILERISPRKIRRVNINSRIVREQQLLWLEEIQRNPEDLLWSEEITLARGNPVKRFLEDRKTARALKVIKPTPSAREERAKRQFWRGILGGVSFSVLLLILAGVAYKWLQNSQVAEAENATMQVASEAAPTGGEAIAPSPSPAAASPAASPPATTDPFVQAVRLAEQAAREGKVAKTSADWLNLASRWQEASDLMAQVTTQDGRYATAQNRIQAYRLNSEAALKEAQDLR